MKKILLRAMNGMVCLFVFILASQANAQNVFSGEGVNWVGQINGYAQPTNLSNDYRALKYRKVSTTVANPADGRGQWVTTVNVQTSGGNVAPSNMPGGSGNGFLFTSGSAGNQYQNKWNFGGVGQGATDAVNGMAFNSSTDMGLNMSTTGRYTFVFKDAGYIATGFYVGYTTNIPVTMTHNLGTQLSVANGIGSVTASLNTTPSAQEKFYVRYRTATNDFSTTSNIVQATLSGTTINAVIPAQPAATVYYYIFSSTRSLAQITGGPAADIAYQALNYVDNVGNNYSYTVPAVPNQPNSISGNTAPCSSSSQTYSVTNDVTATSYTWTLPSGWIGTSTTNSITVTTGNSGGTIAVTATNSGGTSTARTLVVNPVASVTYYADTDNDGFGNLSAPISSCTGQPALTATNSTDCDDTTATKYRLGNFYTDADNDGYNNGGPTSSVCYGASTPSGYTAANIGTDCDDNNFEVNPNHVEVLGNGIDDNCDGVIDEVAPTTSLQPNQCGITLTNIAAAIYANQVPGALGYRFEVTLGANVRTYDSATSSFNLLNLAGGATYATTYSIRVAVKTAPGFWRAYSTSCNITTPALPEFTNVIAAQCGITLTSLFTTIYCDQVTAANQYRFEVSDGVNPARTFDTSVNRFNLTNLVGGAAYATTYSVRVALRFGTTFQDFGPACNVTTPLTPGTSNVIPSQCGITISNSWTTIYATQVAEATGYRFEVVNGASTRFFDTPVSRFNLYNLAGAPPAASTTYTIRVAILYNSVYQAFGSPCTITTAGTITRQASGAASVFAVKAYPNPFASTFKLDINTSSEDQVGVKVYDMLGKLVESREVGVSELATQEVGDRYSTGVYNIIVTQGENVKTLRVIKR